MMNKKDSQARHKKSGIFLNVLRVNKALLTGFILVILSAHSLSAQQKANNRPNIIFFLVDDMGWQDTSVPFWDSVTAANKKFHTPNMERLAKQSMKFTNAYANLYAFKGKPYVRNERSAPPGD
jgi:alkaline phosphatase